MRILLVEDEAPLRETLAARLKREGFAVDAAQDGEEGLYMGREVPFDVGIIDLGLPKMSGMELIKALRDEGKKFPVLILTARSSWQDKVEGLKQGADDYLVKPFHVEELLARVNALLRRAAGWSKPTLECGPVALDLAAQTVSVNGSNVDLTSYEYKVLEYLMMHAGELVSKDASQLMIDLLRRQQVNDRLPRYLGDGVTIAHKTGDGQPWVANDAGLMWVKGQPIVIVVLAGHHRGPANDLRVAEGKIAAIVANHYGGTVDPAGLEP